MGMDAPVRRTMAKTRCESHIQVRDRSQVYSVYSRHYTRVKVSPCAFVRLRSVSSIMIIIPSALSQVYTLILGRIAWRTEHNSKQ
jgi:hypothetical protein